MTDVVEAGKHETVEEMIRAAHKYLEESGNFISPAKVSKLIRRFHREAASGVTFESWAWVYADPTAITAGKRVDRQRARKKNAPDQLELVEGNESTNENR